MDLMTEKNADKKKKKELYNKLFSIVKNAIDDWNPYGLLPDAPRDEFDGESRMIVVRLYDGISLLEITEIISGVFTEYFEDVFSAERCIEPATKIYKNLNEK